MEQHSNAKPVGQLLGGVVSKLMMGGRGLHTAVGQCDLHGRYETLARAGEGSSCPRCFLEAQRLADEEENRARMSDSGLMTFWNTGRLQRIVPPRFAEATFESYIVKDAEQAMIRDRVMDFGRAFERGAKTNRNMIFTGRVGTGKTHLAISLGKMLSAMGFRIAYLTIFDLMRPAQERSFEGSQSIVAQLGSYDLVVLDEVGAHPDFGYSSELVASTLFQLIDSRYLNCLATLLVTNIEVGDLETSRGGLGYRVMDRLSDSTVLQFFWDSAR